MIWVRAACLLLATLGMCAAAEDSTVGTWFEIDQLNAGLGEPPDDLARATPRETVSGFLRLTEQNRLDAAAHMLDLGHLDPAEQSSRGPELVRKLNEILDRTAAIDWGSISNRPDALLEAGTSDTPQIGESRRSLRMRVLDLDRRPAEIRLNRVKAAEADPVWLFSAQTVRDIDALHARYGPGWLERKLPSVLRQEAFMGTRVWEWLVFPLIIGALIVLGIPVRRLTGWIGCAVPVGWINRAAVGMHTPLTIALMAIVGLVIMSSTMNFSGPFYRILVFTLVGLTIVGLTFAALRAIDTTLEVATEHFAALIDDSADHEKREMYTFIYALRRLVLLAAIVISIALLLTQLRLFDNVGVTLLASAGVITVILGIAGQTVFGNILASLQIAIAKPIRIGDAVEYDGKWAYVESIYFTFLVVRTWDGRRLVIPVQYFISHPFENWSMVDSCVTRSFSLKLDHSAQPDQLREVFDQLVEDEDRAIRDVMTMMVVSDHTEEYQEITFLATASNPSEAWMMHMKLRESMGNWIREQHPEWWPVERITMRRR
ncbi:MAG: mechanosensitive ion channel family protein [Xanthomonadaceae bacterium]|nr:mechanosensitive ion channel family protein [Xanthomonadaceae bacterium]